MAQVPEYAEWRPARPLVGYVACTWAGRFAADGSPYVPSVLPDGCLDIVWDGQRLFVAGPDTGPVPLTPAPGGTFAGIRFLPGRAPTFLRAPASALRDLRVDAVEVLGARARPLAEEVAAAPSLRGVTVALERTLLDWLPGADAVDPVVAQAVASLDGAPGPRPVAAIAARLGVSERHLLRRCTAAVGYGPKLLHRVLRLRRFRSLAGTSPATDLAQLAALAGYADQAHLARDARELAGATPAALVRDW